MRSDSKRWCIALATVTAVAAAFVLTGLILFVGGGVSARPEPSAAEAWIARRIRSLAIPSSAKATPNPVPSSGESVAKGRAHFADHCAMCHGNDGRGETEIGRSLYPRAPDMTAPTTQRLSDGELFWIIENGIRLTGMPAWGRPGRPSDTEASWELVLFIRHLPQLTEEEKLEMQRLNPKSPEEAKEESDEELFLEGTEVVPRPHH
jgi:mono/diheme cytochrome c family protein